MNILAIGAHPDDIELGCGGTLLKVAQKGHFVFMYTVTRGGASGKVIRRSNELVNSAKSIGATTLWIDDYEDSRVYLTKELVNSIEFFIRKSKADVIYTHPLRDNHHDHRAIAEATMEAGRFTPTIFGFENPSTRNFFPTMYYDITDVIEKKISLLNLYGSQHSKQFLSTEAVKGLSEYRAFQSRLDNRIQNMEAFEIMKATFADDLYLRETNAKEDLDSAIPNHVIEFKLK